MGQTPAQRTSRRSFYNAQDAHGRESLYWLGGTLSAGLILGALTWVLLGEFGGKVLLPAFGETDFTELTPRLVVSAIPAAGIVGIGLLIVYGSLPAKYNSEYEAAEADGARADKRAR